MHQLRVCLVVLSLLAVLNGCGDIEPEHHLSASATVNEKRLMEQNHLTQLRRDTLHNREQAFFHAVAQQRAWYDAVRNNATRNNAEAARRATNSRGADLASSIPSASSACSSPLPAEVIARESGGDCNAYNPTGCGGRGCLGIGQVDAGHFAAVSPWNPNVPGTCYGLSYDACVAKLYNGGAGLCVHWNYGC